MKTFFFCNKNSEVVTRSFWATRRRAGLKILNRFNYTLLSFYQHYVEHCSSWPDLLLKSISYSEIKDLNSPLAVSRKTAYNLIQGGKKLALEHRKKGNKWMYFLGRYWINQDCFNLTHTCKRSSEFARCGVTRKPGCLWVQQQENLLCVSRQISESFFPLQRSQMKTVASA